MRAARARHQCGRRKAPCLAARAVRQAIEHGQLAPDADPEQISFELFGIALVVHHHRRRLGYDKARARALAAYDALIERHAVPSATTLRTTHR